MDRLPLTPSAIAAIVLVVLLGTGGYFRLLAPKLSEVQTLKAQLAREAVAARTARPVPSVSPVTPLERELWGELEKRFRGRYPSEAELPRAAGAVADLARSARMEILNLEIHTPQTGVAVPPSPFRPPPELGTNPTTIKLVVSHRYRDLVKFLEELGRAPVYAAVQSLEVKRLDNRLTTEVSLATLRWGK